VSAWRAAAIDLGAESGRVVVGELADGVFTVDEVHRFPNAGVSVRGRVHWDVLGLFQEILCGLGEARRRHGELASVGVDTWGVDFALLDRAGALLGNPHHYRDPRTAGAVELVAERVPLRELFARTGLQPKRINTLFQLVAMARNNPEALWVADRLLLMPDLFHFWLGGEAVNEQTIATTSQMYDQRSGGWATDLLEHLELPSSLLRAPVAPATFLGPLLPAVRAATGLTQTRVVAPASHDTASAVAAVPFTSRRAAYISSGTWSLMGVLVPAPALTDEVRRAGFANEGGVGGTTRLLKNITGLWLVQECRRAWARAGAGLDYAALEALMERTGPFGSVIDPDHDSLAGPTDMPRALHELCVRTGERAPSCPGETLRVAVESLACKYRHTLDQLEEIGGQRIEAIHVVGGGARSRILCQLTADLCDRPVLAGPVETTSLGNLMAQALAGGIARGWDEARALVHQGQRSEEYHPRDRARWEDTYQRFRARLERPPPAA